MMLPRTLGSRLSATLVTLTLSAGTAFAQPPATSPSGNSAATNTSDGWDFTIYPVLAWLPTHISTDLHVPGGGSGGADLDGVITDSSIDGAFLGGVSATNGAWGFDSSFMWAAFGGDRVDLPRFSVDVDVIYGYGAVGRRIAKDLYVTGGVRRLALNYDITVNGQTPISRKPGVWDPVVGVGYHRIGRKLEWHGAFEGGGFGVGSDSEWAAYFRADWKPWEHVGFTGGYGLLIFKVSDEVLGHEIVAKQNLNGPSFGLGIYF